VVVFLDVRHLPGGRHLPGFAAGLVEVLSASSRIIPQSSAARAPSEDDDAGALQARSAVAM
jgi:hypothetical protein